ncbi:MAG: Gmad2 immunoglobulin-like domain-containing protein [Actinomycetota bacterium]
MSLRRGAALAASVLLAGALLAACGGGDGGVDSSPNDQPATTGEPTATTGNPSATTPPGTVPPDAAGVDVRVYYLDGGKIATGHRRVAPTRAVARAAFDALIAGPTDTEARAGFTSAVRPETTVTDLDISGGVATVTLSPEIGRGDNAETAAQAVAQIVYTLTQFPTVERVRIGSEATPIGRDDLRAVTPLVLLESVAPGDTVTSPVTVAGESNTFEGTVRIRVLGADGAVLADTFTTATSGSGTWGRFSEKVAFDRKGNTTGSVVVFWDSPEDGSPRDVTEVPVRFA